MNRIKSPNNFITNLPLRLPEVGMVKMGYRDRGNPRTSKNDNVYYLPKKTDYFLIMKKELDNDGFYIPDVEAMSNLGHTVEQTEKGNYYTDPPITEIDIAFPVNDLELIFHSSYRYYAQNEIICAGDGSSAVHKVYKDEEGNELKKPGSKECECPCPYLERGACKPYGELSFMLLKSPTFGGIYKLRTTGFNTTTFLQSSISQMAKLTKGWMAGVPFKLKLMMKDGSYTDKGGKSHPTTFPVAYLEYAGQTNELIEASNRIEQGIPEGQLEREKKLLLSKDNYGDETEQRLINEEFSPGTIDDDPTQLDILDLTNETVKIENKE